MKAALQPLLRQTLQGKSDAPLYLDAALLAVSLKDPAGYGPVRQYFLNGATDHETFYWFEDGILRKVTHSTLPAAKHALKTMYKPPHLQGSNLIARSGFDRLQAERPVVGRVELHGRPRQPQSWRLFHGAGMQPRFQLASNCGVR